MKRTGIIVSWLFGKGFGFVLSSENNVQTKFFLHTSRIVKGKPVVGAQVEFQVLPVLEGKSPSAYAAEIVDGGAV
jgi:cold shock CspA family protein